MIRPRKIIKKTAGRRPTIGKPPADTRGVILAAARRVFARRGLDGASVRDVAEAARVNTAMIYYHFHDKVDLYRAVLADSFTAFDRIWDDEIFNSASTARAKIRKYIEEFIRLQQSNEELRKIISMEFAVCSDNCTWLADNFFTHGYEKLARILQEGMAAGELKKVDPAWAIPALVGMILHSFIMRPIAEYVIGKKLDLTVDGYGHFVTEMFFEGVNSPKRTPKSFLRKKGASR